MMGDMDVSRKDFGPFTAAQINLLKPFADQAVIAIENVRLFQELEARNRDLTEALERQTATAEILSVISSSPTGVQPTFDAIARSAAELCEADLSGVYPFDGELMRFGAQYGGTAEEIDAASQAFPQGPSRMSVTARAILAGAVVQIADVSEDPEIAGPLRMFRTVLSVPMLREGRPLGAITVGRRIVKRFTDEQIELLKTFADQAVIAIENARLFTELEARNRDLTEALEQQTAVAEILRAISSSPTDLAPILETIARNAVTVCGATDATVILRDGDDFVVGSHRGPIGFLDAGVRYRVTRGIVPGRAVIDARPVQVPDFDVTEEFPEGRALAGRYGARAAAAVPLLREGTAIGALMIRRAEAGPFSDKQMQ